jgi:hypothetical protein
MRVLLLFPGALGDLLLLVPAATALARRGCRVELSVCRALEPIAEQLFVLGPSADGVPVSSLFMSVPAAELEAWLRGAGAVHAWFGEGEHAHALSRHAARLGIAAVHRHGVVREDAAMHASAEYARVLAVDEPLAMPALAFAGAPGACSWRVPGADRLVIQPGAGSRAKRWTSSGFLRVADGWAAHGGETVILLGPAEEDLLESWRSSGHRCVSAVTIAEAGALVASAARYVGNDSGISHLAGATGRAGAVLFGPTRAERWRPLGGGLVALRFPDENEADLAERVLAVLGSHTRSPADGT